MAGNTDLTALMIAIANVDHDIARELLTATPSLTTAGLERRDEFFLAERLAQVYERDTALHAAGFSYDSEMAQDLIRRGADIRARNRRGADHCTRR
jgi:ankyrin repeat protein